MRYKITAIALCAVMLLAFTGCQLALSDDGYGQGRLIGMYVTTQHVDLFDHDAYMQDAFGNMRGGDIVLSGNADKYQGRLYATLVPRTLVDEETGKTSETADYIFEDLPGVAFFAATITATDGRDSYRSSISSPGIVNGNLALSYGDTKNSIIIEGTVYISPSTEERTFYMNPVFQSDDGSVYLTTGSGYMIGGWTQSEGIEIASTLSESRTVTENGESITESVSVTLALSVMYAPIKIAVLQMDADGLLLARSEYSPERLPAELVPHPGTAYIVVETHKQDTEGMLVVSRSIYGTEDKSIGTFSAGEDGICIQGWTQILWK